MKRSIIVLVLMALIISEIRVCAFGSTANNNEVGEELVEGQNKKGMEIKNLDLMKEQVINNEVAIDEKKSEEKLSTQKDLELENDEKIEDEKREEAPGFEKEKNDRVCLQIPEKLGLTIDPFEINGKGQIYSKNYVIKNVGTETGILTLSNIVCKPGNKGGVNIVTENKGIHETDEKSVYVKIVFENQEVVLSQEGAEYETRLAPGEELLFHYSGEVSENASRNWEEKDVTVGMLYFWNMEEELGDEIAEEKAKSDLEDESKMSEIKNVEMDKLNIKDEVENLYKNNLGNELGGDEKEE